MIGFCHCNSCQDSILFFIPISSSFVSVFFKITVFSKRHVFVYVLIGDESYISQRVKSLENISWDPVNLPKEYLTMAKNARLVAGFSPVFYWMKLVLMENCPILRNWIVFILFRILHFENVFCWIYVDKNIYGSPTEFHRVQRTAPNWNIVFLLSSLLSGQASHKNCTLKIKKAFQL